MKNPVASKAQAAAPKHILVTPELPDIEIDACDDAGAYTIGIRTYPGHEKAVVETHARLEGEGLEGEKLASAIRAQHKGGIRTVERNRDDTPQDCAGQPAYEEYDGKGMLAVVENYNSEGELLRVHDLDGSRNFKGARRYLSEEYFKQMKLCREDIERIYRQDGANRGPYAPPAETRPSLSAVMAHASGRKPRGKKAAATKTSCEGDKKPIIFSPDAENKSRARGNEKAAARTRGRPRKAAGM